MKIQLAPGQRLVIGFYIPANQQEDRGWRAPEDQPLDGEFVIEYGEKGTKIIIILALINPSQRGFCRRLYRAGVRGGLRRLVLGCAGGHYWL